MFRFAAFGALTLAFVLMGGYGRAALALVQDNPFDRIVPLVKVGDPLPATRFVDQAGRKVRLDQLHGDAVAIAFVYTRCRDACPIISRKLQAVHAALGNGPFRLVEVTIDPERDRPAAIASYAREYGIESPMWLIVTGEPPDVDDFNRRMGVQAIQSGRDEIIHNDRVVLVSPSGAVADIIEGSSWTPDDLTAQLRHLAGMNGSLLNRFDLALGAAVAFCGGAVSGRAGFGDLLASIAVFAGGIGLFVWLIRRTSASRG